jgi:hypothetical protein
MSSRYQELRSEEARTERLASQTEALRRWLAENHKVVMGEAHLGFFKEHLGSLFLSATEEQWQLAFNDLKKQLSFRPTPTRDQQKEALIEEIRVLLTGIMSPHDLKNEITKLQKYKSLEEVVARRDQIRERQRLAKMDTDQIRSELQAGRPRERRYFGYPDLPETIVPAHSIQAVRCDAAYLIGLAKIDFYEYKKLVSKYGSQQITDRQLEKI